MKGFLTEQMFLTARWLFLVTLGVLYSLPIAHEHFTFPAQVFIPLFSVYFITTAIQQVFLYRKQTKYLAYGIFIDLAMLLVLLGMTGGVSSIFIPAMYLLVMHTVMYWRVRGAALMTGLLLAGYWLVSWMVGSFSTPEAVFLGVMNSFFLLFISVCCTLIVMRERQEVEKSHLLRQQLREDYLTGLYNKRAFHEQIETLTEEETSFYLYLVDIDHFKEVNDQYGHVKGDEVLEQVGLVFKKLSRKHRGRAFRYGGEEFAFLFPGKLFERQRFLADLADHLTRLESLDGKWRVTVSVGESIRLDEPIDDVLGRADEKLYEAKRQGRACAVLADGTLYSLVTREAG